jgi:uncharacterized repeat protein (TIGR03943 family)
MTEPGAIDMKDRPSRRKRFSPARVATGAMLAAWAGMFWFLIVSGRELLYVSTRTRWVVPTGAVILTAAAIGRLASVRTSEPESVGRKEAWILGLMVVPVITVLLLPPSSLGTYAASRRSSFLSAGVSSSGDLSSGRPLTLIDLASTVVTELDAAEMAKRAGEDVSFVGIVTREASTAADEFYLTRFVVTCCVADATVARVLVVDAPPGKFEEGDWVQVDGTFYPLGDDPVVAATSVRAIDQPLNPYMTPR